MAAATTSSLPTWASSYRDEQHDTAHRRCHNHVCSRALPLHCRALYVQREEALNDLRNFNSCRSQPACRDCSFPLQSTNST